MRRSSEGTRTQGAGQRVEGEEQRSSEKLLFLPELRGLTMWSLQRARIKGLESAGGRTR